MTDRVGSMRQKMEEDPLESDGRKDADFLKTEAMIFEKLTKAGVSSVSTTALLKLPSAALEGVFGFLGNKNPFARNARADQNLVWIFDTTAYKPSGGTAWTAEAQAAFFQHGRGDLGEAAAGIADIIGLDGKAGTHAEKKELIQQRLQPFIDAVAPARSLPVTIQGPDGQTLKTVLGPSNTSGISTQVIEVGGPNQADGTLSTIQSDSSIKNLPKATGIARMAGAEGWGIISDIDDTIKITQTPDPIGILRTTFAEPAQYTSHMPEFYKILNEQLQKPAWFYVSASPYNLYPFLHTFINDYYPPGPLMLRDASWQTLGGLTSSLTQGVKQYKTSQIDNVHKWLPQRKFICVGDSTQMDPETYAAAYKKYPDWIKAIYIRKVLDAPHMAKKNTDARFMKAFEGIPSEVWQVFVLPDELNDHLTHVMDGGNVGVLDSLKHFFCGQDRSCQQQEKDRVTSQPHKH